MNPPNVSILRVFFERLASFSTNDEPLLAINTIKGN